MAEEHVSHRNEVPEKELYTSYAVYGNAREIYGKDHFESENKIAEEAVEEKFDKRDRDKIDVLPAIKKKKRKKLRERRKNNDVQGKEESEAKTVTYRRGNRKSKYERKKKEATDVDGTRLKSNEPGQFREHQLPLENLQNIRSDGLWLGTHFIQNKNYSVEEKQVAEVKQSVGHFSNNNLFLASSFQPESHQNNTILSKTETNKDRNSNTNRDPTNRDSSLFPDGNHSYIKRRKKKRNFKKRLANLKKTSSKISILPTNLESAFPRLELSPERSDRPSKTSENRDRTAEEADKNSCQAQFLEPLQLCRLITKFPLLCFCKFSCSILVYIV